MSFTTVEYYIQAHEPTAIMNCYILKKAWERFADDADSIPKRMHLQNVFHHINNLHQNIIQSRFKSRSFGLHVFFAFFKK